MAVDWRRRVGLYPGSVASGDGFDDERINRTVCAGILLLLSSHDLQLGKRDCQANKGRAEHEERCNRLKRLGQRAKKRRGDDDRRGQQRYENDDTDGL